MVTSNNSQLPIFMPKSCWDMIIEHCNRKLVGKYITNEPKEKKAFGIIAGRKIDNSIQVKQCFPLMKNARHQEPYKSMVNKVMEKHAIPSETPLSKRGWVADTDELHTILGECQKEGITLIGTYHMHRVAWDHDALRDTPTELDTVMAFQSRLVTFIVSMVTPERPVMRAYYEGDLDKKHVLSVVP